MISLVNPYAFGALGYIPTAPLSDAAAYDAAVLADGPVLFWKMDEASGTTATDSSGNGNDGTYGSAVTVGGPGLFGGSDLCPTFIADDDDSVVTSTFADNLTTACTLECLVTMESGQSTNRSTLWSKIQNTSGGVFTNFPIELRRSVSGDPIVTLQVDSGNDNSVDTTLTSGTDLPCELDGKFHVVGVYRDSGLCEIYINGFQRASTTIAYTIASNALNWAFGRSSATNAAGVDANNFKGKAARAAIYDVALSASQILAHYTAGIGGAFGSSAGIDWASQTSAADNLWTSVAWSPELALFVAVGASGTGNRVMTSPNGASWTIRTSAADNDWVSVAWSPALSLFVAVAVTGTGNRVMTSPNGINWTARVSAANNNWRSVAWAPSLGLFVAVANSGTGNRVMTSADGINWTIRTSAADNAWLSVAWAPSLSLFVAVANSGTGNRVMTSPDGINWTARTSAADNAWAAVAWSEDLTLFVAVASSGTGNRVMTSPDGVNWTIRVSAADIAWQSVAWSSEQALFVAVAGTGTGNRVMTSPDGVNWTIRVSAADNNWFSVAYSPLLGVFAAVATSGTGNRVMTSPP